MAVATQSPHQSTERDALISTVKEWGYFDSVFKNLRDLLEGRRVLDIGMGGGPLSVAAVELAGCASYVGVDPHVGTDHVLNPRAGADPNQPRYMAFPYTPAQIMAIYPNIHLYTGYLEDVAEQIRAHQIDMAIMSSVTEHLQNLPKIFKSIWQTLEPDGLLWFTHHGYHSWTGHHQLPRSVADWDRSNPRHNAVTDWKHLDPDHPSYRDPNFNRVRLGDFRRLVETYFDVVSWRRTFHATERLTPELRRKYGWLTTEELLTRTVTAIARRRSEPLSLDLPGATFFHPPDDRTPALSEGKEDIAQLTAGGSVFFASATVMGAHTDNDCGAAKIFASLKAGDGLRLVKGLRSLEFTVDQVRLAERAAPAIVTVEPFPAALLASVRSDWGIAAVRRRREDGLGQWQTL